MNGIVLSSLALAAIIAISCGELCTPDQWEAIEASFGGYEYHRRAGTIKEHNKIAYDATNQRKASFITYINNDYENKFQMVVRYDKGDNGGKAYLVDLKKGTCWTKSLDKPFRKACIPDDNKKVHDYSLGLKGAGGLKVTGYLVKMKEGGGVYLAVTTNADKTIIPVLENIQGSYGPTLQFVQAMQYGDVTAGISNATIFDIPEQCKDEVAQSEILDRYMSQRFFMGI